MLSSRTEMHLLNPRVPEFNTIKPTLHYSMQLGDKRVFDHQQDLTLPYDHQALSFELWSSSTANRAKNAYRYRLIRNNVAQDWKAIDPRNESLRFQYLDAGDYDLQMMASNNSGIWSEPKSIKWTVSPPPWLTWWAYTVYALALVALIYLYVRIKLNANKKLMANTEQHCQELLVLNAQLSKVSKAKSEFIAKVSHELRTPLTGIQGMLQILKGTRGC